MANLPTDYLPAALADMTSSDVLLGHNFTAGKTRLFTLGTLQAQFAAAAAAVVAAVVGETLTPNGGTDFLTSIAFLANTTALFWNGVALARGVDYTEITPRTLRFLGDFPQTGDSLTANYTKGSAP